VARLPGTGGLGVVLVKPPSTSRNRDEDGAVAVLVAVCSVALFMIAALVVDLGLARDVRRQAQNAADASSLAGVTSLYPGSQCEDPVGTSPPCLNDAIEEVTDYALDNFDVPDAAWFDPELCTGAGKPSGYVNIAGGSECIAFDDLSEPRKVWVRVPIEEVKTGFGTLAGVSEIPVSAVARATLNDLPPDSCSLCFMGTVDAGNGDFSVYGSNIRVNGSVTAGPNSVWTATEGNIGVVGDVNGGQFDPPEVLKVAPFDDPLAGLVLPLDTTGLSGKTNPCATDTTGGPGIYGTLELPNSACTLQPGLYVVRGTWGMKNNTLLKGSGVTIYVQSPSGRLDFKNGIVDLEAPTSGTTANLAIIYDRDNTQGLSLQGNGDTQITGTVYALNSVLEFNGNSCFGFAQGPVVAGGVYQANGNQSCVEVSDSTGAEIEVPPGDPNLDQ
jgi:hypothetical protein